MIAASRQQVPDCLTAVNFHEASSSRASLRIRIYHRVNYVIVWHQSSQGVQVSSLRL
jgi:hypothetical protein